MGKNLFSVPIFFIVFRETLEAAIIVSVLLGLVEQIVRNDDGTPLRAGTPASNEHEKGPSPPLDHESTDIVPQLPTSQLDQQPAPDSPEMRRLIRRLRIQIFLGAGIGLLIALAIGAAFIAVWFTQAADLWAKAEALWEGIFELIASLLIFGMGVTMLKMDRAKAKWRVKLQRAFFQKASSPSAPLPSDSSPGASSTTVVTPSGKTGKYVLLILPLITVLREGIEAVVFVGGVSLGQPATSIPIAAIVGLICGLVCGWLIYAFASRSTLTVFLVVMTNLILLIGAGLFSKAIGAFQENAFNRLLGADVDDAGAAGDGPGSYDVRGNVWHLNCCNPERTLDGAGWGIFAAVFGWTNSATLGSVLGYVVYWVAVAAVLVYLKFKEGRSRLFGRESAAGRWRRERRERGEGAEVGGKR